MNEVSVGAGPRHVLQLGALAAVAGTVAALVLAFAIGNPTPEIVPLGGAVLAFGALVVAILWPFQALRVMLFSCFVQIVWVVRDNRAANPFDILILPLLAGGFLVARPRLANEIASLTGSAPRALVGAMRRLVRSTTTFYGLAILSLGVLVFRGQWDSAFDSGLLLLRAIEGICFFAVCLWWIRTREELRGAIQAVELGTWTLIGINLWYIVTQHIARAGMTWVLNQPEWPMTSPNEAAVTLLVTLALLQSRPKEWRGRLQVFVLPAVLVLLVLTRSRSGLIAWLVYSLFAVRWRWKVVVRTALAAAIAVPLVPASYWGRLARTLSPSNPSLEAYGNFIRLYTWQTAWRVFLDHPIFGVGYMGFRFISVGYNPMRLVLHTVENYFFEVTTGMGLVGLVALVAVLIALVDLGEPASANTPRNSLGFEMARRHRPLMLALFAANLTGDNFMGMVGLAQIALWCALLIRSAQLSGSSGNALPATATE